MNWHVYILRCADNTLYTGITTDIDRRLAQHAAGRGAKYTRTRAPFELVFKQDFPCRSSASKREWQIKSLTRAEKMDLISPLA